MKWKHVSLVLLSIVGLCVLTLTTTQSLWKHTQLGLDLRGGYNLVYQIDGTGHHLTAADKKDVLNAVVFRVNAAGIASPNISLENNNRIDVALAGAHSAQQANAIVGQTSQLRIYGDAKVKEANGNVVPFSPAAEALPKAKVVPTGTVLVTGSDLKSNASWEQDAVKGNVVVINFKNPTKFQHLTSEYLHRNIYTFLDGKLINAARVGTVISSGKTEITGMTQEQCMTLAKELNAGALPYPLHLIGSTTVGPSLGTASLHATMIAALLAIIGIFVFMVMVYRLAGVVANIALVAYAYVTLAVFAGLHIVLTLPGLAALVLGMGMAVDANIIAYERIREETRQGKSLLSSVISGNRQSFRTIVDSNVTTLIAGAVMYAVGQGDIRGFALALMLGILSSMLTAVFFARFLLWQFVQTKLVRTSKWLGFGPGGQVR